MKIHVNAMRDLTQEQLKAVSHRKGPACVIAGAGTGKTFALIERIAFLVNQEGLPPDRLLITTFTRKATAELYERTYEHEHLGEKAHRLRISTIDALVWDLSREAMHRGLMPSAQLIDEARQRLLLLHCFREGIFYKTPRPINTNEFTLLNENEVNRTRIIDLLELYIRAERADGQEKNVINKAIRSKEGRLFRWLMAQDIIACLGCYDFRVELRKIVPMYLDKIRELHATDYDLLTRDFLKCLRSDKKLAKEFASHYDSILVDEFQDTSRVQGEILLLLAGKRRNIWVVGDPCQQIYEWRGAGPENLLWFVKQTRAKKYYLTDNWRSTQPVLDGAYSFLKARIPSLRRNGMLKPLKSRRNAGSNSTHPIYSAKLKQALSFIKRYLAANPNIKPSDIAILSHKLVKKTAEQIENKARDYGLQVQFHSSRADRAMERTIVNPPQWRPGNVLKKLYQHPKIRSVIASSLRTKDFSDLRMIRPLATAADAVDSTVPAKAFTFREAWPVLKKTQDREVSVTPAVVSRDDAIQVMTIHAAKGLEFPVVLLMTIGKSFPNDSDKEASRLVYVGATRARDLLIIVHTDKPKPEKILQKFGPHVVAIRHDRNTSLNPSIVAPTILQTPPIIAASHLDFYEQCPLKFAAYHEGRLLPQWSVPQSIGSRMHKALEYFLRADMPESLNKRQDCFDRGLRDGDSSLRALPPQSLNKMKTPYKKIITNIAKEAQIVLMVEQRYRYIHGTSGQVEGVIDALVQGRNGISILKEWKTAAEITPDKRRQYELQARAGALGLASQNRYPIHRVDVVPVFDLKNGRSMNYDSAFVDQTRDMLDHVFKDLRDRKYEPRRGKHCSNACLLKRQCPAWTKSKNF